jgi:hypothetical protein
MKFVRRIVVLLLLLSMNEWTISRLWSQTEWDQLFIEWQLEKQLWELTNEYRGEKGIGTLAWDDSLAEIAREHSQEMALQGFISHEIPSGNGSARMIRAGYTHATARENIARSRSFAWAYHSFLSSPTHVENMVAADVTSIGIGIVRSLDPCNCPNTLYITVLFASPIQSHSPKTAQKPPLPQSDNQPQASLRHKPASCPMP